MAISYQRNEADERPWGRWEVLDVGPSFVVKRISVKPGARLSLQLHNHREEHWVIVRGVARVTIGEKVLELGANQSAFVPVKTQHRIENPGEGLMEFIEVQVGENLDEGDIVRFEDDYRRA